MKVNRRTMHGWIIIKGCLTWDRGIAGPLSPVRQRDSRSGTRDPPPCPSRAFFDTQGFHVCFRCERRTKYTISHAVRRVTYLARREYRPQTLFEPLLLYPSLQFRAWPILQREQDSTARTQPSSQTRQNMTKHKNTTNTLQSNGQTCFL